MSDVIEFCITPGGGNAGLSLAACTELASAAREWRREAPPAVVIEVTAGAWRQADAGDVTRDLVVSTYQRALNALLAVPCPVVVALSGEISGVGISFALAADIQYATPDVTMAPGPDGPADLLLASTPWLALRAAGAGMFAQLAWLDTPIDAHRAVAGGLLTAIGSIEDARARAGELARRPVASMMLKKSLRGIDAPSLTTALGYDAWLADVATDDESADA